MEQAIELMNARAGAAPSGRRRTAPAGSRRERRQAPKPAKTAGHDAEGRRSRRGQRADEV